MKMIVKVLLTAAAMAAFAVPAMAADKLIVRNAGDTADVFKVGDDGVTTISNKQATDSTSVFTIKTLAGDSSLTFNPIGVLNVGVNTGQFNLQTYAGDALGSQANVRPVVTGLRSRGTTSSPLPVMLNDKLGTLSFGGWDGSAFVNGSLMEIFVDGAVSTGSVPTRFSIVTGSSPTNRAERLLVKANGVVQINGLVAYADNTAAKAAGLTAGQLYRTSTGIVMVVF